jgi:hypothetical protein
MSFYEVVILSFKGIFHPWSSIKYLNGFPVDGQKTGGQRTGAGGLGGGAGPLQPT